MRLLPSYRAWGVVLCLWMGSQSAWGQPVRGSLRMEPQAIEPGAVVEVEVIVDLGQRSDKLGAYTAQVTWAPGIFELVEVADGATAAFAGPQTRIDDGAVVFSAFNVQGAGGVVSLLKVRLQAVGRPENEVGLALNFSALAAAQTFENLLPHLQVTPPIFTTAAKAASWGQIKMRVGG